MFENKVTMMFITRISTFAEETVDKIKNGFKGSTMEENSKWNKSSGNENEKFKARFSKQFYNLGYYIGEKPLLFLIIPIFLTIIAATGFREFRVEKDVGKLFYPYEGPAPYERQVFQDTFPINYTQSFLPTYAINLKGFARIFVTAQDGGSVLRKNIFDEFSILDEVIKNVTIIYESKNYTYYDLCAMWEGNCFDNKVFDMKEFIEEIELGTLQIVYPFMIYPFVVPMFFGGLEINEEEGYIVSAKSYAINYFLRLDTSLDEELALKWEKHLFETLQELNFTNIRVDQIISTSVEEETQKNMDGLLAFLPPMVTLLIAYTLYSVSMNDWVRSKGYIGLMGIVSACLGYVAATGLLSHFYLPSSGINNIIPFLMLGIGLDDMFVVLAAWRRSSIHLSVPQRLADTYAEAGVSITITSLTNIVSFTTGLLSPYLAVRLFCIHTAVSLVFVFLWHLTFYGACLAYAGRLEKNQRHSVLFVRVTSKSEAEKEGNLCYKWFMAGGINPKDPYNPIDNKESAPMVFFRDVIGEILMKKIWKYLLLVAYLVYLSGAIYGFFQVKEGLDRVKVFRSDSYAVDFFTLEDQQFRKFPYSIQVALTGDLNYSDPHTRERILSLHDDIEKLPFIYENFFTQSGIRQFYRIMKRKTELQDKIQSEEDFIYYLKKGLTQYKKNRKSADFIFTDNDTKIAATRFVVQAYDVKDTMEDLEMVKGLRKVASEYSDLNVTTYNPNYYFIDQYDGVRNSVMQATGVAAITMIIISLIFIPKKLCSLVVGFSIVSIEIGVIGYMSLWGVNLDPISTINLLMCIGFSVDCSAHISYAYLSSIAKTVKDKVKDSLYCSGHPVFQGGVSTILCVATLALFPSYAFRAFFKVVFLVITCAVFHGIFIIPILLSLFDRTGNKLLPNSVFITNITEASNQPSKDSKKVSNESVPTGAINIAMDDVSLSIASSCENRNPSPVFDVLTGTIKLDVNKSETDSDYQSQGSNVSIMYCTGNENETKSCQGGLQQNEETLDIDSQNSNEDININEKSSYGQDSTNEIVSIADNLNSETSTKSDVSGR